MHWRSLRSRAETTLRPFVMMCLTAATATAAPGCSDRRERVTIAIPVATLTFAPTYIAEDRGFWKEQGLDVKLNSVDGVLAMNALLGGNVDFANISSTTFLRAHASGQKVVAIANMQDRVQFEIVVSKSFAERMNFDAGKSAEERARTLRGARIAVGAHKSFMHSYLTYVAKRGGLDPERDVTVTPILPSAMLAALRSGQVDGLAVSRPWSSMARKSGLVVTVVSSPAGDFPELTPFNTNLMVARAGYCEAKATICRKVVAGLERALAAIRENPGEAATMLRRRFEATEPDIIDESLASVMDGAPTNTRVVDTGFKNAQEYMLATGMLTAQEKLPSFEGLYSNAFAAFDR